MKKLKIITIAIITALILPFSINAEEIKDKESLLKKIPDEITLAPIKYIENKPESEYNEGWYYIEKLREEARNAVLENLKSQGLTYDSVDLSIDILEDNYYINGYKNHYFDIYTLDIWINDKVSNNSASKRVNIKYNGDFNESTKKDIIEKSFKMEFEKKEYIMYEDIDKGYDYTEANKIYEDLLNKKISTVTDQYDIAPGHGGGGYNSIVSKGDTYLLLFKDDILYQIISYTTAWLPSIDMPTSMSENQYIEYVTPIIQKYYNKNKGDIQVVQITSNGYNYLENYTEALEIDHIEKITEDPVYDIHQALFFKNNGEYYRVYFKSDIKDSIYTTIVLKKEGTPNVKEADRGKEVVSYPITSIKLNKTSLSLVTGKSEKLTATITPTNTTDDKTLTWTSSNTKVATVDASGNVKAIAAGTANITVKTSNGKTATVKVTVTNPNIPITSVKINQTNPTVVIKKTTKLTATINPSNTTNSKTLTWSSSDKKIATVDKNGVVTGVKAGTATITVKTSNGKTASVKVTVKKATPIKSVKLNKSSAKLELNKTLQLKATINPSGTTDDKTLTWTSSNKKVATVDKNGKVTAIKAGTAKITVKTSNGKKATVKITVSKINAKKAKISAIANQTQTGKALKPSVTLTLNGKTLKNGTDYTVTYKNNKNAGKATVTVKFKGNYTGSVKSTFLIIPKKVAIKNPSTTKKSITVKYTKVTGAKTYQIAYRLKGTDKWTYTTKTKISKLTSGKEYEVMVRAGIKSGSKTLYGAWSDTKVIKVK